MEVWANGHVLEPKWLRNPTLCLEPVVKLEMGQQLESSALFLLPIDVADGRAARTEFAGPRLDAAMAL